MYPQDCILLSAVGRVYLQLGDIESAVKYFAKVEQFTENGSHLTISETITI